MNYKPSILLIIFNRPDKTKSIIKALSEFKPPVIYVSADGPRDLNENATCNYTRSLISMIDWDCKVITNFIPTNLGCKVAVSKAIDWFFSMEDEGIILEDDCLPSNDFYEFCSTMLEKYRYNDSVGSISGTKISPFFKNYKYDYFLSKYPNIWGWATWKRVWSKYDVNISNWEDLWRINKIDEYLSDPILVNYWRKVFKNVYESKIDTWDYQFVYLYFKEKYRCIIPNKNLIKNIGFDAEATHTLSETSWVSKRLIEKFNLNTNSYKGDITNINYDYDVNLEKFVFIINKPKYYERALRYLYLKIFIKQNE